MSINRQTSTDFIRQVRQQLDEDNTTSITDAEILDALSRAQDYAANIFARHYEDPLLVKTNVTLVGGTQEYDIPEDALEGRLEKVEIRYSGNTYTECRRIKYRDLTYYETDGAAAVPYYYAVVGNKYHFAPPPNGIYNARIWYLKNPDPLVLPQGRINIINTSSNYIIVDELGTDISTQMDELASYVNIIDGETGELKATLQIQALDDTKVTFKSTPTRSTVLGRTISSSIPTTINVDDYICVIGGNCIPFFKKPTSNFLIQFAVAELQRKLGGPVEVEMKVLQDFEDQVKHTWVGREQQLRVKKRNNKWISTRRRFFYTL